MLHAGLHRLRDSLFSELRDLNKSKPRGRADENLIAEINRLESTLLITKDDLVRHTLCCYCHRTAKRFILSTDCLRTQADWRQR